MSDPKQDHESDVAIAAESRLDHESGADLQDANHKVGATPLIMGALEKLASATDQMAQQIGDRLDTATEQQISREQGMRQTLAEGLDAIGSPIGSRNDSRASSRRTMRSASTTSRSASRRRPRRSSNASARSAARSTARWRASARPRRR